MVNNTANNSSIWKVQTTYGHGIDEQRNEDNQQQQNDECDEIPLVVLPDDVLECLPGRGEPEERGLGAPAM